MKAKFKKTRRIRKAIEKIVSFLLLVSIVFFTAVRLIPYYPRLEQYFQRFLYGQIDTYQIDAYYDLLVKHAHPGEGLVLNLGVGDNDSLQVVIDRLKILMHLEDCNIGLAHHDAEKPPAYIKQLGHSDMNILVSTKVTQRREEINLLVHEMTHIYVWRLDPLVFGKFDQEKLVDCSGVFLGLGVLTLNGLTDEYILSDGDDGYQTRKKLFGYLQPEQFGYLLARYCIEHGIAKDTIKPFLNSTGWKYFNIGYSYLKKSIRIVGVSTSPVTGIYWCPKCSALTRVSLSGKIKSIECPNCKI